MKGFLLLLLGAILAGCAGCDTKPSNTPTGGTGGAGGAMQVVDACDVACERAAALKCPQAETVDGVTCADLCRQVPVLRDSAACAARASDCAALDECSSTPDGG